MIEGVTETLRHLKERFREHINEKIAERIIRERIDDLLELINADFIDIDGRYGIEQFFPDPEKWDRLDESARQLFNRLLGKYLGVELITPPPEEQVIRRYHEEGVIGKPSEGGAEVTVLRTKFTQLEVHVMTYQNPELGVRYDLVRSNGNTK